MHKILLEGSGWQCLGDFVCNKPVKEGVVIETSDTLNPYPDTVHRAATLLSEYLEANRLKSVPDSEWETEHRPALLIRMGANPVSHLDVALITWPNETMKQMIEASQAEHEARVERLRGEWRLDL